MSPLIIALALALQLDASSVSTDDVPTAPVVELPAAAVAPAVDPPAAPVVDPLDPMNLLDLIEKAVTTKDYSLGAGAVLLLVVYVVRRRWSEIPPDMLPAVTLAIASVPALALTLMRPQVSAADIWKQFVMISLMAGGAWSAIGKRIFNEWVPKLAARFKSNPTPTGEAK